MIKPSLRLSLSLVCILACALTASAGIQAPRLTATATDKPVVFSSTVFRQVEFDGSLTTNDLVTLTVTNGTLTLGATDGLSFTAGNGSADSTMSFRAALGAANVALEGLAYQPNPGFTGGDALTVSVTGTQSTNRTVLVTVSPWLDLAAAQDAILAGVDTNLSTKLLSGTRLVPFGRSAGGLFYRTMSSLWWEDYPQPSMAAVANWGNGRIVVLQGGAGSWNTVATNAAGTNFLNQAVRWASRTTATNAVIRGSTAATITWLQTQGYSAAQSASWWTSLAGVNLVIVNAAEVADWTANSAAVQGLRSFALAGGGVILHGGSSCADELFDTGIYDTGNSGYSGYYDALTALLEPPPDSGLLRVVDRSQDPALPSATTGFAGKELSEFQRSYSVMLAENYLQIWGDIIAYNKLYLSPTPARPVSGTWPLALLNAENACYQALPAAQVPKFRTADQVYGAITPAVPRVTDWVLVEGQTAYPWQQPYSTGRIRKRQPTGLYCPPGEVVTVRFPAAVAGKSVKVLVGNNLGLTDYDPAQELPNNTRSFTVSSADVQVANAMGGPIVIELPANWSGGSFNVQILGAVRHPYFRLGRHTNAQWVSEIRERVPNCLIIEGDHYYNMLGAEFARDLDDMESIAQFWEDSFVWFDWQRGWERSGFKPGPFPLEQYATRSTSWGFNSGITANFSYGSWGSLIDTNTLWSGYNGYHHESGHSHEQEFYANTGARPWYPNGDSETYANVLPYAPIIHMGVNGPKVNDNHDTIPMWRWKAFQQAWTGLHDDGTGYDYAALVSGDVYYDNSPRMGFWSVIMQDFGLRFFREMCLAGQTNTANMTGTEGNDWRLRFFGSYFGRNFSEYFAFLGVTNSAAAITDVAGLPAWRPVCGKIESNSTPANVALTVNLAGAANVYSLDGIATLVSVGSPRNGTIANNGNGTATFTPAAGFQGYGSFQFALQSSSGDRSVQEFLVVVGTPPAANNRPMAVNDNATTGTATPVTLSVLANDSDPDGDAICLWRVECPLYGTATNNGDGTITYTPDAGHYGKDEFTYVIHDGRGGEHRARVFVSVTNAVNHGPALTSNLLLKGDAYPGLLYNNSLSGNASDADQWDKLTFAKTAGPAWLVVNPDGSLGGQPALADVGTNNFTVQVADGRGAATNATVRIVVRTAAAFALGGYWPFNENSGTVANDASGNGFNGTINSCTWLGSGKYGSALTFNGSSSSVSIPAMNLNANTVTLTAWVKRNGSQTSWDGLVFCRAGSTVAGMHFGTANELRYTWDNAGGSYNFNSGLTLPDNAWTFCAVVVEPTRAVLYISTNGVLAAATNTLNHPAEAFDGTTYIGQDSTGGRFFNGSMDDVRIYRSALSAAQLVQVFNNSAVSGFTAPVFASDPVALPGAAEGRFYTTPLASLASDADGDPLTYSLVSGPNWLSVDGSGTLNGIPPLGSGGTNALTLSVADGKGNVACATVLLPVNGAPYFPVNPLGKSPAQIGQAYAASVAADAVDVNGDSITFSKTGGPAWLSVASNGALSGTPASGDAGLNSFVVQAADPAGLVGTATVTILVSASQPAVWTGGGANDNWNQSANWNGTLPTNGQALLFLGSTRVVNTNNLLTSVGQVTLQNGGFSLSGNVLSLRGGILNAGGDNDWNIASTLASAQTFAVSNGTLTVDGVVTNGGYLLTVDGAGDAVVNGVVTGSGGLTKSGPGTLTLTGLNTYSGATTVNAGRLVSTSSEWGGSSRRGIGSGALIVNSGAVAQFTSAHAFGTANGKSATLNGGVLQFDREQYVNGMTMAGGSIVGNGEIRTSGNITFTVNAAASSSVISTPINQVYGAPIFNVANGAAAVDLLVSGNIFGGYGVTKSGAGLMQFTGTPTYTGATTVSAGTLQVDGSLPTNTVTVANTATLAGVGVINGPTTIQAGGTVAPGAGGIGTLTFNNTLALSGKVLIEISKSGPTLAADVLAKSGTLTCAGTLTVANIGPDPLAQGDKFTILSAGAYAGSFTSPALPTLSPGLAWDTSRLTVDGSIQVIGLPTITNQPQSLVVNAGNPASFTVGATGSPTLAYQWRKDGVNIGSATTTTYAISSATINDAASYTVVVTNSYGSTTSAVATLTVNVLTAPSITVQPQSVTTYVNSNAAFSVTAGGSPAPGYQWRFNGTNLASAIATTYVVAAAQTTNEGGYTVVVTNSAGAITSSAASLTLYREFGRAPAPYPSLLASDGARHLVVPGFQLGQTNMISTDARTNGLGDDGVQFTSVLQPGQPATVEVVASAGGWLNGWLDYSANGAWTDLGDQVFTNVALVAGTNTLNFTVPATAVVTTNTWARFRFSSETNLASTGQSASGEVEDYPVAVAGFTLAYSAGPNGSIGGTTLQTVNYGGSGTAVTATPNAGYEFASWSDGSTANPRTDSNVTSNSSVVASFVVASGSWPAPWTTNKVGVITAALSATYSNGAFVVTGGGAGISGKNDSFWFVNQAWASDVTITARVVSEQNTGSGAKAGVIIRESTATGARSVFMGLTPTRGAQWVRRTSTGGNSSTTTASGFAAPYWVRLTRSGNAFAGYISSNGANWTSVASASVNMASNVMVGLAVCSGSSTAASVSVFDNVNVTNAVISSATTEGSPVAVFGPLVLQPDTVDFQVTGEANSTWTLEESSDAVSWAPLQSMTLINGSVYHSEEDDRRAVRLLRLRASPAF